MTAATERRARRLVAARSGGVCEVCDLVPATEWHHRQNRSQGGAWCPANGLALCASCHRHITLHPRIARNEGWAVSGSADPTEVPARLARHGWCLLSPIGQVLRLDLRRPWSHPW